MNTISDLVITLGNHLKKQNLSLVTAESFTGGALAYHIAQMPGASCILERAYVVYSLDAKKELLAVKESSLENFGAVSKEVAIEMAQGALDHSHAQVSAAITGLGGPNGDGSDTPVGTVYIGCAALGKEPIVIHKKFSGERDEIVLLTVQEALKTLINLTSE